MTTNVLILLIVAGALLGVYVGKLPRWIIYALTAVVLVFALLVIRGEVST